CWSSKPIKPCSKCHPPLAARLSKSTRKPVAKSKSAKPYSPMKAPPQNLNHNGHQQRKVKVLPLTPTPLSLTKQLLNQIKLQLGLTRMLLNRHRMFHLSGRAKPKPVPRRVLLPTPARFPQRLPRGVWRAS